MGHHMRTLITFLCTALAFFFSATTVNAKRKSKYDRPYDPYFEEANMWTPQLSPDGKYIALGRRNGDDHFVIIQEVTNPNAKPVGINLGDKLKLQWIEWANNDRIIYSVFKPWDGGIGTRPVVRLFGMNKDGSDNEQFFRTSDSIQANAIIAPPVSTLPNDPEHILIPVQIGDELDLLKLNVNTSKFSVKARGKKNTRQWYADIEGNAAAYAATRDNGRIIDYFTRVAGSNDKNLSFKLAKSVRRDRTSNSTALDFLPVAPGPTSSTYYVIARPNGADTAGIHLYDFEQNSYTKKLFQRDDVDVRNALIDWRTGDYEGAIYNKQSKAHYDMADSVTQKHYNALAKYFGPSIVASRISTTDDGKTILFSASGPGDPGSYHIYDVNKAFAHEIGTRMTTLPESSRGVGKVVNYKTRDGLELYGYLTQPTNMKLGEKPPLIMMPHGGPEARSEFGYSRVTQLLVWKGYQVFEPNFRGSTGRGLKFADMGRKQWGKAMQNDIDDALLYLDRTGIVDADNACIMGFSYGGYAALAAATLTPDTYKCVIAGAAPADLIRMLRSEKAAGEFGYNYWTRHIGDMNTDAAAIYAVSPAQLVKNVKAPILLHHGNFDNIVPYEQGQIMKNALEAAGKDFTWVSMNKIGHSYPARKNAVRNKYWDTLFEFLDKNLPISKS